MKAVSAISEHPLATQAVGEVVGEVLEAMGTPPDVAVLFVSGAHRGTIEDIARAVRRLVNPRVLVGACDVAVIGSSAETSAVPAVALWAVSFGVDVTAVRLQATPLGDTVAISGGGELAGSEGTLVVMAEGTSFPMGVFLDEVSRIAPDLAAAGGVASIATPSPLMLLDDEIFDDGAVGVLLPPSVLTQTVSVQATRPFGDPLTVTRSHGNVVYELAGRQALEVLNAQIDALDEADRILLGRGLHVGLAIDEHREHLGPGDFLVRRVLGADRRQGALQFGESTEVGRTVQFHLRDPRWASRSLVEALGDTGAVGALVFSAAERGASLFGIAGHDAAAVADATPAMSGMVCGGEIARLGGVNRVDEASVSVFLVTGVNGATDPGSGVGRRG